MGFIGELWEFLMEGRRLFMLPIIIMLGSLHNQIMLTQGFAVSTFTFPIF
jgi:hypothetical protein